MLYWDMVIKDLDKEFIDTLANDFDIDYYKCNIDTLTPIEDSVPNQIIKYIYEEAIDKIVDDIPEEIFEKMYEESLLYIDNEEVDNITYDDYKEQRIEELKDTLKDSIYLNYMDSSIDCWTEKLANEYSQELADYIFEKWLINY